MRTYIKNNFLTSRLLKFCTVGASGVIINMGTLYVFTEFIKFPYFVASLVAIELSILSNFSLNIIWTWKDRKREEPLWTKLIRYHIGVGVTAFFVNYLILIILTEFFGTQYLISNLIGISIGTVGNFVINDLWTFKNPT